MPSRARALISIVSVVLAIAGLTASCGGSDSGSSAGHSGSTVDVPASKFSNETGKRSVEISATDNDFTPVYVIVSAGTKVTWDNNGRNAHNIVPVDKGSFTGVGTSDFGPGQVYTTSFPTTGDYPYYCSIHGTKNMNGMSGVIRVVAKK
jgi:plastocyanin